MFKLSYWDICIGVTLLMLVIYMCEWIYLFGNLTVMP